MVGVWWERVPRQRSTAYFQIRSEKFKSTNRTTPVQRCRPKRCLNDERSAQRRRHHGQELPIYPTVSFPALNRRKKLHWVGSPLDWVDPANKQKRGRLTCTSWWASSWRRGWLERTSCGRRTTSRPPDPIRCPRPWRRHFQLRADHRRLQENDSVLICWLTAYLEDCTKKIWFLSFILQSQVGSSNQRYQSDGTE